MFVLHALSVYVQLNILLHLSCVGGVYIYSSSSSLNVRSVRNVEHSEG